MVDRIVSWCLSHRTAVYAAVAALSLWGTWAVTSTPIDAIPDIAETQVIISTEWTGRSPDLIEDHVTYPIVSALLSVPNVRTVRGLSDFGISYVYVIFDDSVDQYWARARISERLQAFRDVVPEDARLSLGPDATAVGWVFEYALVDETGTHTLDQLRSLQDWTIKYGLSSVPGVAEVASIGGFVRQYQVNLDPDRLSRLNVSPKQVVDAIRASNGDIEGRLLEFSGREYMVRARGQLKSIDDIEEVAIRAGADGVPVRVGDVAEVRTGPDIRRGVAELDGRGEVVGGIIVMRAGEHTLTVINRIKERLAEIKRTLPETVAIVPVYDRSDLIHDAIATLRRILVEEIVVVTLVVIVFLSHVRAALIPTMTLVAAVLAGAIPLAYRGVTANIMSLGGIALAIGVLVDASIVVVENGYRHVFEEPPAQSRSHEAVVAGAIRQVGRPVLFSLAIIIVSFLPVFLLDSEEGRLFAPLALTKTLGAAAATLLALTFVPALMIPALRRQISVPITVNRITRVINAWYERVLRFALQPRWRVMLLGLNAAFIPATALLIPTLGREFMPPLYEGSILYMPTARPGLAITEAMRQLQIQDRALAGFPEVQRVFGTAGRGTTASDNSPLSMINTIITLRPRSAWRPGVTFESLQAEMDAALQVPGFPNVWTQPIRGRLDMLSTGIKSALGVKILGSDVGVIQDLGQQVERVLAGLPGARAVYADRPAEGRFVDIDIDRAAIARYGLTLRDVQDVVQAAVGGSSAGVVLTGRERYPIIVRYQYDFRSDIPVLQRVRLRTPTGSQLALSELATISTRSGPAMIRSENGSLAAYVYIDIENGVDLAGFVESAQEVLSRELHLMPGYRLEWSGEYESQVRVARRLKLIGPIAIGIVFLLLYVTFQSAVEASAVMVSVVYAMCGGVIFQWILGYQFSVAVWVGYIALWGVAVQTGVLMVVYLQQTYDDCLSVNQAIGDDLLIRLTVTGATLRLRPKLMTAAATIAGLLPILWSSGAGSDLLKPIAAPIIGGLLTSTVHVLLITPMLFFLIKRHRMHRASGNADCNT
jgi:Cu(I)/Ag(I) efflux system membrane protein CusA/SilA